MSTNSDEYGDQPGAIDAVDPAQEQVRARSIETSMPSFVCHHCGESHQGLPTSWAFREPDEVFALSYIAKYLRVRSNEDLCTLDESRFFLRGNLRLPLSKQEAGFSWGIWVKVSQDHHDVYAAQILRESDGESSTQFRFEGRIANSIPGYRSTLGLRVDVLLGDAGDRPSVWLKERSRHALGREQSKGISCKRHHQLLEAAGWPGLSQKPGKARRR